ncbi:MAG: hypothetical protein NTX55_02195 [Candidatus Parcubacteria bacterium]|nr:hypothetical protein [Candidatus Parcubacteria bacterium]
MSEEEYKPNEPTEEEVAECMGAIARQFGERFEAGDPTISEEDIVKKHKEEGWEKVDTITNAANVSVADQKGKQIKVVGLGTKFLVFEKKESVS